MRSLPIGRKRSQARPANLNRARQKTKWIPIQTIRW